MSIRGVEHRYEHVPRLTQLTIRRAQEFQSLRFAAYAVLSPALDIERRRHRRMDFSI